MRVRYALLLTPILLAAPHEADAQEGTAAGAVTGALAGALVGGPLGAVVGGVLGAAVGSTAHEFAREPPKPARPMLREPPVRIRTCVRDSGGRETCKTTVR